jgi:uncharacterized protein YaiE (UPF0345 family)
MSRLPGQRTRQSSPPGTSFEVRGDSAFDIAVDEGLAQYVCSFLA